MKCRYCGAALPESAIFCTNCGKSVVEHVKSNEKEIISEQPLGQEIKSEKPPYSIPSGYSLDDRNGLYYISDIRRNAVTGQSEQHVTYFNTLTGEYMKAVHPIVAPPAPPTHAQPPTYAQPPIGQGGYQQSYHPQQLPPQKGPKVWLIILILALSLILVAAVVTAVVFSIKSVDTGKVESSSVESSEETGSWETERQRLKDEEKKREAEEAEKLKLEEEAKKIGPITSNKTEQNSWHDFPQNSFYYARATQNAKYNYFTYRNDADTRYQFIYRQLRSGGDLELVLDVGEEFYVYGLTAVGDYLFYIVVPADSEGYLDYDNGNLYYTKGTSGTQNFLYKGESGSMALDGGFVYLIQEQRETIIKVGMNKKGEIGYEEIAISTDYMLYSENISVLDGKLYINTYDQYSSTEMLYRVDLENGNTVMMYEGKEGVTHDYIFVNDMDIYYINYNVDEDSSTIERSTMGDYKTPEVLLDQSWVDSEYITDFLARVDNQIYFSKGQEMFQAPMGQLDKGELLFEMDTYAYGLTSDTIFMPEKIYHIDSKVMETVVKPTNSPLVKFDTSDFDAFEVSSYSTDDDFSPFYYQGDVVFSSTGENLFETIAHVLPALDFDEANGMISTMEGVNAHSRYFLESKALRDLVVDSSGRVDMDIFKVFMYDVFLNDYIVFDQAIQENKIPGFVNIDGEIYLDEDWKPEKAVKNIETEIYEERRDAMTVKINVTYTDGTSQECFVYYYEEPSLIAENIVYYITTADIFA